MSRNIILASASPQRKTIMETLGLEFKVIPSEIDEQTIVEKSPVKRAELVARAKAEALAKKHPNSIIIAADTYGYMNGKSFEKPKTKAEARIMLRTLSGREFLALTGFCYLDLDLKVDYSTCKKIEAKFRHLTEDQIDYYVENEPVTSWSAAFSPAYPVGASFIAEMDGSFNAFTYGLPTEEVMSLLEKSGVF